MTVYLGARDKGRGEEAAAELSATGVDVRHLPLDVTDPAQAEAAAAHIDVAHGRLDVLVNNAGTVGARVPAEETTVEQLREVFKVNVFGMAAVTRACVPLLRRAPHARIVNLSTPLGSVNLVSDPHSGVAGAGMPAYSSSKAAVHALTPPTRCARTGS